VSLSIFDARPTPLQGAEAIGYLRKISGKYWPMKSNKQRGETACFIGDVMNATLLPARYKQQCFVRRRRKFCVLDSYLGNVGQNNCKKFPRAKHAKLAKAPPIPLLIIKSYLGVLCALCAKHNPICFSLYPEITNTFG
jgi:hypothetical protein